jgi:hypothetical protein
MLVDALLGKDNEAGLAGVSFMKAYCDPNQKLERMVDVLGVMQVEELIKGLVFVSGVLSTLITGDSNAKRMYDVLRANLLLSEGGLSGTETELMNILDASEDSTPGKFFLKLYSLTEPVEMLGMLAALNFTLMNNPVFQSTPMETLDSLRNSLLDDYINKKQ